MLRSQTITLLLGGILGALSCRSVDEPQTIAVMADSADHVYFGVIHAVTTDGVLRARIEADTAYFYEGTQTFELKQLKATFYTLLGAPASTITAAEGTYQSRTGDMEARIDVVGVTPDGRRLTTSVLSYGKLSNRLTGPEDFVFDAPDRHLEGTGFTADPGFRDIRATGISARARNQ